MNRRCAIVASALLVVFGGLMVATQLLDYNSKRLGMASVIGSFSKGQALAHISDIVTRDDAIGATAGSARRLDLILPANARLFMAGMTGTANGSSLGHYYYLSYYLFPREVAVTLDQPRLTESGFQGRSSDSDEEMLANGFYVRVDLSSNTVLNVKSLHDLPIRAPANPGWFGSPLDMAVAFLLPLMTALSGIWLLRLLFGSLSGRQSLAEQMACGLGLGMMAVAALTLGLKLSGFHGHGWVLVLAITGALAELWHDRKLFRNGIAGVAWKMVSNPLAAILFAAGLAVFVVLFRLAALQGIIEFDAVAAWLFKAKIIFLSTGSELVGWFSNPRLAYAHLDYPTLVPSLHAATYDSIGHVDEFVTKFWPTWMLLFLLAGMVSLCRNRKGWLHPPHFFLLGVLLLPFTQAYVQMEGGTLPMVFFTVMGIVQCTLWLRERDPVRLALGLTLMFGAAMTKFEGVIFLALATGWIFVLPSARPSLEKLLQFWPSLTFCFLTALPFICLRIQIPALHFESGWAAYAMAHPIITLSSAPKILLIMVARLFVDPAFARWSAADGQLHWTGQWDGPSSLYNHLTPGLPWVCVLMTILLWLAVPARRPIVLWMVAVYASAMIVLSIVFASFVSISGLNDTISARTANNEAGRYLFPMLLAWASTMVTLFFRDFAMPVAAVDSDSSKK